MRHIRWLILTSQGVLLPPSLHYTLLFRVCCCHPYCIYFAGYVAATLTALHIIVQGVLLPPLLHSLCRVCCCHPYCITHYWQGCVAATLITFTLQGVLLPPYITRGCTQQPWSHLLPNNCVVLLCLFLHAFLSDQVVKSPLNANRQLLNLKAKQNSRSKKKLFRTRRSLHRQAACQ